MKFVQTHLEAPTDAERWRRECADARQQAGYWKAQFERAKQREAILLLQVQELLAKIKHLEHQLFGDVAHHN